MGGWHSFREVGDRRQENKGHPMSPQGRAMPLPLEVHGSARYREVRARLQACTQATVQQSGRQSVRWENLYCFNSQGRPLCAVTAHACRSAEAGRAPSKPSSPAEACFALRKRPELPPAGRAHARARPHQQPVGVHALLQVTIWIHPPIGRPADEVTDLLAWGKGSSSMRAAWRPRRGRRRQHNPWRSVRPAGFKRSSIRPGQGLARPARRRQTHPKEGTQAGRWRELLQGTRAAGRGARQREGGVEEAWVAHQLLLARRHQLCLGEPGGVAVAALCSRGAARGATHSLSST